MQSLDFDLEIGGWRGDGYVVVARSLGQDRRGTLRLNVKDASFVLQLMAMENAVLRTASKTRRLDAPEATGVRAFGQRLFEALFSSGMLALYEKTRQTAEQTGRTVRLQLRVGPQELSALPWEFLYDARRDRYLCLDGNTPLIRYISSDVRLDPLEVTPPLRVLGMAASPPGCAALDLAEEQELVERAVSELKASGRLELVWLTKCTWRQLQHHLRSDKPWHVLHFIGHGGYDTSRQEGLLVLEGEQPGTSDTLTVSSLADLLLPHRSLRLVFLNSCDGGREDANPEASGTATTLVRRGIPAVLAMQYAISDRAAIEFSRSFYEALADGVPVDRAVSDSRVAVKTALRDSLEWGTPVLFTHAADGVLFSGRVGDERGFSSRVSGLSAGPTPLVPPVASEGSSVSPEQEGGPPASFDVFLSHNSKDKPAVRELKRLLAASGLVIWLDEDELRPGMPWQELLASGIHTSNSVAVLVGRDGLGPWEDEEMQAALRLAVKHKRPVIPVLLPGAAAEPELPFFLSNRTWVDLRGGLTKDGLAKLIWGITGKKPPDAGPPSVPTPAADVTGSPPAPSGVVVSGRPPHAARATRSPSSRGWEDTWNTDTCPVRLVIALQNRANRVRVRRMKSRLTVSQPVFESKQSFAFTWDELEPTSLSQIVERVVDDGHGQGAVLVVVVSDQLVEVDGSPASRAYSPSPLCAAIRQRFLAATQFCGLVALVAGPSCRTQDIDCVLDSRTLTESRLREAILATANRLRLKAPPGPAGELAKGQAVVVRLARDEAELRGSLELRYQVYTRLGYLPERVVQCSAQVDLDCYDPRALHFVAEETQNGNLVGSVRLVLPRGISERRQHSVIGSPPARTLRRQAAWCQSLAEAVRRQGCPLLLERLGEATFASLPILQSNDFTDSSTGSRTEVENLLSQVGTFAELSRLVVWPRYRGLEISRLLIRAVVAVAVDLGLQSLVLECVPEHVPMYEKYGFARMIQGHLGRDQDLDQVAVAMRLDLASPVVSACRGLAERDLEMIRDGPEDAAMLLGSRHLCLCNDTACWQGGMYVSRNREACPLRAQHPEAARLIR
ncbi:MAG TPA: GNAT family N-acetyltransferase [Candidatus Anammoximicrobium sp.]|nr:GNAT family N-acetyltransferase [Candidatus Anammoximicrobium sp.]